MMCLHGLFSLLILLAAVVYGQGDDQDTLELQTIIAEIDTDHGFFKRTGIPELEVIEQLKQKYPDVEFTPLRRESAFKTEAKTMSRSVNTWPCGKEPGVCAVSSGSKCGTCCADDPTGLHCCPVNPATCCNNGICCSYTTSGRPSTCCNNGGCCPYGTRCWGNYCLSKRSSNLHQRLQSTKGSYCPMPIPWTCPKTKCCTGEGLQVCCKSNTNGEECLDVETSCTACPSPKCTYPSGITEAKVQSAFNYLRCPEGFSTISYCPKSTTTSTTKSGPTVGAGVDLGQQSRTDLERAGVPSCIIDRVKILLGKKCTDSCVNPSMNPDALVIHLSEEEAKTISKCFVAKNLKATNYLTNNMTPLGSDVLMSLKVWTGTTGTCDHVHPKLCREVNGTWVNYVWDAIKGKTATDDQLKAAMIKTRATYKPGESAFFNRLTREIKHLEGKCSYPKCC